MKRAIAVLPFLSWINIAFMMPINWSKMRDRLLHFNFQFIHLLAILGIIPDFSFLQEQREWCTVSPMWQSNRVVTFQRYVMINRPDIVAQLLLPESHSVVIFITLLSCGSSDNEKNWYIESPRNILQGGHRQSDKEPIGGDFKKHYNQLSSKERGSKNRVIRMD